MHIDRRLPTLRIDTISMGLPIVYFMGTQVDFFKIIPVPRGFLILANSADPDEMQQYAAFHLGLHCMLQYTFSGFEYT